VSVPKILILTGDAAESLEVMYPYQRLREEGYEVHIAAFAICAPFVRLTF
jgi:protease I